MNILINCTNLKLGGALQVADSICRQLHRFPRHTFFVVLNPALRETALRTEGANVNVATYTLANPRRTMLTGRDPFLDEMVSANAIDACLTVFGPTPWKPRCKSLEGFALSFYLVPESPFMRGLPLKQKVMGKIHKWVRYHLFKRSAQVFWTENPVITERLQKAFGGRRVVTVTNYYNQVFDDPSRQHYRALPPFKGTTLLTVASPYPHKNLAITLPIARILKDEHPEFRFRFVITAEAAKLPPIEDDIKNCFELIGKVDISECPSLYEQADIMFLPTLLESFSASYPEAMRMGRPIVTTDLEFAHGLCGDAACYYSATDAYAAAQAILRVATNADYAHSLVERGTKQLEKFDNYEERTRKLIEIIEQM